MEYMGTKPHALLLCLAVESHKDERLYSGVDWSAPFSFASL